LFKGCRAAALRGNEFPLTKEFVDRQPNGSYRYYSVPRYQFALRRWLGVVRPASYSQVLLMIGKHNRRLCVNWSISIIAFWIHIKDRCDCLHVVVLGNAPGHAGIFKIDNQIPPYVVHFPAIS